MMKNHFLPLALAGLFLMASACQENSSQTTPPSTPTEQAASAPSPAPSSTPSSNATPGPKSAVFRGLTVQPFNYGGHIYMGIRQRVPFADIQPVYGTNMNVVFNVCYANELQMDDIPTALFYEYDEVAGEADMAAVIGVKAGKEVGQGVKMISLPAGVPALKIDYYGNYRGIADAHYAMNDYLKANGLVQNRELPAIEEYVTSPAQEPDPEKRLTRLIYFHH
ncbi:MAG: GyrI-like domain-containing protein [Bacteroidota bacterium]